MMAFSDPIEPTAASELSTAGVAAATGPLPPAAAGSGLDLPLNLQAELQVQAEQRGCSLADLVERLLRWALAESPQEPAGRCSTRMGRCSSGPVPLPVQQL